MDNNLVKYPHPSYPRKVLTQKQIFAIRKLWPWRYMGQGHDTSLGHRCVKYYPDPTLHWGVMARTQSLGMCALWPWRYGLVSRSWHTLPWVMDNKCVKNYPDSTWQWGVMVRTRILGICARYDDMTLGQGRDTPLGHEPQLCKILFRSNMAVRSYGPDTDIGYVCTVTLEIWPWVSRDTPLGHEPQLC